MGNVRHRKQDKESNLTQMLLMIVGLYIFCSSLPILFSMYQFAIQNKDIPPEVESVLVFFITVNSSVNFLIYCAFGQRFRNVFYDTFSCYCCCPKKTRINNWRHSGEYFSHRSSYIWNYR